MLRDLGLDFAVVPAPVDETPLTGEKPEVFAKRMARAKATAVARQFPRSWVIGADTVVSLAANILGKPRDHADAMGMLRQLSGRTHLVMTGFCLCCHAKRYETTLLDSTRVTFNNITDAILDAYIRTGEPFDKAGAYGIQGLGSFLIRSIEGSCSNVIGLPIDTLVVLLLDQKIIAPCHHADTA